MEGRPRGRPYFHAGQHDLRGGADRHWDCVGPAFAGGHGDAGKCSGPGGALYADHFRRNAGSDGI